MTSNMPPGWYHAEGDPPGTQRYWDGVAWQGGPEPVATPAYGQAHYENSQATIALVASILGLVCCALGGPVGWYLGHEELKGIDAGRRDPSKRGTANAARIIGIVATVLSALAIIGYGVLIAAAD